MKKILITGGGGQLALSFYSMFQNKYQIFCLPRKQFDVTNINQIKSVMQKYNPDTILHCAAMTDVDGCEKDPTLAESVNSQSIKKLSMFLKVISYTYQPIMFLMALVGPMKKLIHLIQSIFMVKQNF